MLLANKCMYSIYCKFYSPSLIDLGFLTQSQDKLSRGISMLRSLLLRIEAELFYIFLRNIELYANWKAGKAFGSNCKEYHEKFVMLSYTFIHRHVSNLIYSI